MVGCKTLTSVSIFLVLVLPLQTGPVPFMSADMEWVLKDTSYYISNSQCASHCQLEVCLENYYRHRCYKDKAKQSECKSGMAVICRAYRACVVSPEELNDKTTTKDRSVCNAKLLSKGINGSLCQHHCRDVSSKLDWVRTRIGRSSTMSKGNENQSTRSRDGKYDVTLKQKYLPSITNYTKVYDWSGLLGFIILVLFYKFCFQKICLPFIRNTRSKRCYRCYMKLKMIYISCWDKYYFKTNPENKNRPIA